jgi:hypothetical protein
MVFIKSPKSYKEIQDYFDIIFDVNDSNKIIKTNLKSNSKYFLFIYSNNCGYCKEAHPEWETIYTELRQYENNDKIIIMDIEDYIFSQLKVNDIYVDGVPKIIYINGQNNTKKEFNNDRKTEHFIEWIKNTLVQKGGKSNKRKTNKRKMNKRKTNKRKMNKRKTNKRKMNKRKTNKK